MANIHRSALIIVVLLAANGFGSMVSKLQSAEIGKGATKHIETIPPRPDGAVSGSQFAEMTKGLSRVERLAAAAEQILQGNVPEFLRTLVPVQMHAPEDGDARLTATIWVTPDYLSIGDDKDFLRIPLALDATVAIADRFQCILPTKKMVDEIYQESKCHLEPEPMTPGPEMCSNEYFLRHQQEIERQRKNLGYMLGDLIAGHKKDIVLTNRLNDNPDRIAIYGWHRLSGVPIQPLSTVHGARYADYSHGVRLIYGVASVNGQERSIIDVLQNPALASVLCDERVIANLPRLLHLRPRALDR